MIRLLIALALAGSLGGWSVSSGSPVYPLKVSGNGRYLVDQNNVPCLILGDSPQALIVNLTTNEAATYFADRSVYGFNTLWVNLLCSTYTGGRADASTVDGILPFTATIDGTGSYDLSAPNEAYFARVDEMVNLAAQQGIQVLLDPAETGSFLSVMLDNGTNRCRDYGRFLGSRYRDVPNIVWLSGNDFQTWSNPADDAVVRAVAQGIQDTDTNHLQTAELDYVVSSSLDDTNWDSILTLNATYTYYPTYARLQQDYNRAHFLPNFLVEANYEFENLQGPVTTPPILRKQEWWTMTSGAAGQMYGNHYTWPFANGWQANLDTPGAAQLAFVKAFFEPRAWYDLVPDTNHAVVTAGYGTYADTGHVADNDYLTAARAADGSLVVIYTPVLRQFTVAMSALSGPAIARWYDPSSGSYVHIAGSPFANTNTHDFTPPGNNSDGDGGWVLVLETNAPPEPPPPPPQPKFVQQNYATPQAPQVQVTVAFPTAQAPGDANLLAIGWNDASNNIAFVGDASGNTYLVAIPIFRGNGMSQAIYYATPIAGGSNSVTVTFDRAATFVDLRVTEYSGLSPSNAFDAGNSGTGVGDLADSGPATIGATNELIYGAGITATAFSGPGGGFVERVLTSPDGDIIEDQVAPVGGSYHATATLSSGAWLMQAAAFRAAGQVTPTLRIFQTSTNTAVVAWPTNASGFTLQQNDSLSPENWADVTNSEFTAGGEYQIVVVPSPAARFYRLVRP